ncbi:FRG domain-containing protein [Neisseria elongata]|uniref:FRG domain-containing protein n=1 Tax=Neisseria elongata TaxID=495 RepID=UPI0006651DC9|nr:FRG domain-containing protein [Neisseria elongata]
MQKKPFTSLYGFIQKISEITNELASDEVLLFRGHSKQEYELIPSVYRNKNHIDNEDVMIKELISFYPDEFIDDSTSLERLIRAQHYGLPTRLLDVTWNPLVALWFTLSNPDSNGEVIVFKVKKDCIKYYDSDTASCLANLSFLNIKEKEELIKHKDTLVNQNQPNQDLPQLPSVTRLLHFIGAEKPHFINRINYADLFSTLVIKSKMNNRRVSAQSGAFLLLGLDSEVNDNPNKIIKTHNIKIAKNEGKRRIKAELESISITEAALFPDISQTAKYLSEKYN